VKRWPLVAASAYAIAVVVGLFVVPSPPDVTASGAALVEYYQVHGSGVRLVAWLGAVSLGPLALLIAHLRTYVRGVGRDVMLLGAMGVMASTAIWLWLGAGLALHPSELRPDTARAIANVAAYFGPVLTVAVIMLVTPVGMSAWRGGTRLPRWLGAITAVFVVEQSLETVTIVSTSGFTAPGGAMNLTLGAGLFLVWILAAGIASTSGRPNDQLGLSNTAT